MKIKAGFLQFNPVIGNQERNIDQISGLLQHASDADLIVIPELANSGYNFDSKEQAFELSSSVTDGKFVRFLIKQAKELKLYIVSGILERDGNMLYNSAVLVGPEGFLGKYRKIHLFMNEFDIFEKGDAGLPVFEIKGVKIGILICFDWVFPEVWRILALKGADIICHPSNLVLPYAQQAVPVHGMVNRVFCITSNRYGTEGNITFSGKSIISDPFGNTLVKAEANKDACIIRELDIDLARDKMITDSNHAFTDRRPESYEELTRL